MLCSGAESLHRIIGLPALGRHQAASSQRCARARFAMSARARSSSVHDSATLPSDRRRSLERRASLYRIPPAQGKGKQKHLQLLGADDDFQPVHKYMLGPRSRFRFAWDSAATVLVAYLAFMVPYLNAFPVRPHNVASACVCLSTCLRAVACARGSSVGRVSPVHRLFLPPRHRAELSHRRESQRLLRRRAETRRDRIPERFAQCCAAFRLCCASQAGLSPICSLRCRALSVPCSAC